MSRHRYIVELDPRKQAIVQGEWPATIFVIPPIVIAATAQEAREMVAAQTGVSQNVLKAGRL